MIVTEVSARNRWRRGNARPRIWAHRGASARALENTLAAFVRADADGIELDVRSCRTGELVVFHDDDLRRLVGRPGKIAELPLVELRAVRLPGGHRIPLLAEVIDTCRDVEINIELKSSGLAQAGALPVAAAQLVRDLHAGDRVLVSSFDPWALVQLRSAAPELMTALLFQRNQALPGRRGWAGPWIGASAMHPEHVLCNATAVATWHQAGYAVNVWGTNDPARLRELVAWGVDGVIVDDPVGATQALRQP